MTPENTPRMAERTDRQAQIDPWKRVETYVSDICLPDGDMFDVDVCLRTEVDAARAADALRHQQELRAALSTAEATIAADAALLRERDAQIASLTAERDQMAAIIRDTLWMAARYADGRRSYAVGLYNDARVKAEALGCAHEAWPAVDGMDPERPTLTEELATLRAERDAAQQEAAKWKASGDVMEAEKVRALQDAINLQQENKTLREALHALRRAVAPSAAGDAPWEGMPQPSYFIGVAERMRAREPLVAALSSSPRPQEPQP